VLTRRTEARTVRIEAAELAAARVHPAHPNNGDESSYRDATGLNFIGNFTKGLPHDPVGVVDRAAYHTLLRAINAGSPEFFEQVTLGTPLPNRQKLRNPLAGVAFDLEGLDAQALSMPPAPRLDSAEAAGEMVELYYMALLRDVHFSTFAADPGVNAAAAALMALSDFRGPKPVTPATIFRGFTPGDLTGPYVSQFLLKPVNFGTIPFNQRQWTDKAGIDFLMIPAQWRAVQNGVVVPVPFPTNPRLYVRNMRDLATYVHFDALYEAYLNACLILMNLKAPLDHGNPYLVSQTTDAFGTFGDPHILSLVCEVATRALKAVWFQKWYVHRRLRPEAFAGLVHHNHFSGTPFPLHPDVTGSPVLALVQAHNFAQGAPNSYLLPMAFPEGSPMHPAYGAGHATVAGACVTILKAWFDESAVFDPASPDPGWRPVVANLPGTALVPAPGAPHMTVGGELNKLAANIAIGRNMAGVHWRSDYTESVKLGEQIAIDLLEEQKLCYREPASFSLTRFDGSAITI